MNPLLLCDGYKLSHRQQYPENTTLVYSNWTPRKSRVAGIDYVVNFGLQYFIEKYLIEDFNTNFFNQPRKVACEQYKNIIESYLGVSYDVSHIYALHDLGYLPIEIKALPEGTLVPIGVPMFTIVNTLPEFFWITNYLETIISNVIWQPMTSATMAHKFRQLFEEWAEKTGGKADIIPGVLSNIDIQGHDFSMRGMGSVETSMISGMGHLLSFKGTDTLPAVLGMKKYYPSDNIIIGTTVPATEHSVMCAGSKDDELETFKRLITKIYPSGVVSIVSDTWDLWKVLTEFLPILKEDILARNGKVVIRPDSGDPVDILCGDRGHSWNRPRYEEIQDEDGNYLVDYYGEGDYNEGKSVPKNQYKGVVELLWDVFGGTINEKGYKVLHPVIGCIYGDSINLDRANQICSRLEAKGFASTNWVAGIGSFTYQYNTRDTFGFAMKATYVEIEGKGREIFKDPITDDGTKKSKTGLLQIVEVDGKLTVIDKVTKDQEKEGLLQTVFINGELKNKTSLTEIRNKLWKKK